jgi:hypothetical protein
MVHSLPSCMMYKRCQRRAHRSSRDDKQTLARAQDICMHSCVDTNLLVKRALLRHHAAGVLENKWLNRSIFPVSNCKGGSLGFVVFLNHKI